MLALTTGEISLMRSEVNLALPGTAVLQTRTTSPDGQGGFTQTYAASSTVSARLSPSPVQGVGVEAEIAARVAGRAMFVLTLAAETTVAATGRVVYNGVTYEVVDAQTRTPWELSHRVFLAEVD